MNATAGILLALASVSALANWWAVAPPGRRPVELAAKPATLALLIGVALVLDPADSTERTWFVVALALSLAGDVFLMLGERWFVAGLGSFLLAHLAYVAGFWASGEVSGDLVVVGVAVVLLGLATIGRVIVRGVHSVEPQMAVPVTAYMVVISAMVVSAVGTGDGRAIVGALLFYVSDALIAYTRFIEHKPWGRVAVMVTYHLGQAGLVLSLL